MPPVEDLAMAQELEAAEAGYLRVEAEIRAQSQDDLAAHNVDIVTASSTVLGVAAAVMGYRDRAEKLPEFEIRHFDRLVDYAKAAWYLHITNLPTSAPKDFPQLNAEVTALRAKLLMWAEPLAASGAFPQDALAAIKEGAGTRNNASDLVSLVVLYRSKWDVVQSICGVTLDDLDRGSKIGTALFAMVSRRDNQPAARRGDASLRVRQAWTLLDRAYSQCRRAIAYFRYDEGDVDTIAPSLRRNIGPRAKPEAKPADNPQQPATPTATPGPSLGGDGSPFLPSS
ncbi:MAG: hypothetical protein MUF54_20140 [Polyangiaceae bacterium]|jgi:hypothetical protein|nr:hypothetical protein [Polyangiaceae bacterium]